MLGGGGITGIAWELGVLAGLAEAGVTLGEADLVVGTSAGSVVGAQLAGGIDVEELYAAQLAGSGGEVRAEISKWTMAKWGWAVLRSRDPRKARARIGRMALSANTVPEAERRAVIESRLPVRSWPERRLLITAVDATSGEFATFDRESGVAVLDAVAASCAVPGVWPPVSINGRRWIDGGMRSPANCDLAADCGQVVILAPMTDGFGPAASVAGQAAALRKSSRVAVVAPDEETRRAIGRSPLDPARRAPAARAGRAQAPAAAASVAQTWSA